MTPIYNIIHNIVAILLTVARILSEPKYMKNIYGSVKFCFQPAEGILLLYLQIIIALLMI